LAQDPEPKIQQAAQQTLQLRLVQSVTAPEKATLEAPLADVPPAAVSQVESQRPSQLVQPSPPPAPAAPAPTLPVKAPTESLQTNTPPPNPATVLDQPAPTSYKKKKELNLHYTFIIEHENEISKYLFDTIALNTYYDCFYYGNPGKYVILGDLLDAKYSVSIAISKNPSKFISYVIDDRLYVDFIIQRATDGYIFKENVLIFNKNGSVFKINTINIGNTCREPTFNKMLFGIDLLINKDELNKRLKR